MLQSYATVGCLASTESRPSMMSWSAQVHLLPHNLSTYLMHQSGACLVLQHPVPTCHLDRLAQVSSVFTILPYHVCQYP